jgi:cytochrome P450
MPAIWQLLRYSQAPLSLLEECARQHGDTFLLRLAGYGKFVILAAPEAVRDVFRGEAHVLHEIGGPSRQ